MNERIEKIVNDELKSGNLAGVSICAIKNGKEIYNKQFGYSNLEERTKVKMCYNNFQEGACAKARKCGAGISLQGAGIYITQRKRGPGGWNL